MAGGIARPAFIILCLTLAGCASVGRTMTNAVKGLRPMSPFKQFYKGEYAREVKGAIEPCSAPEIYLLPNEDQKVIERDMLAKGFSLIGKAAFHGPDSVGNEEAFDHGQEVGACVVLWRAEYLRTKQGIAAVPTYNPGGTSTTYHSGSVYSGRSSGYYSGTSTTYHSDSISRNYVPYSVDIYDYVALYFARTTNNPTPPPATCSPPLRCDEPLTIRPHPHVKGATEEPQRQP